jgi:hypothetical protein
MRSGSCLCGAVTFDVSCELPGADACHCNQCRKQSGHYFAATEVPTSALTVHGTQHLRWFHASAQARRGFCSSCGSTLFWDPLDRDSIAIAMGAFDGPTQTTLARHVYVADKGDYYVIDDDLPQE